MNEAGSGGNWRKGHRKSGHRHPREELGHREDGAPGLRTLLTRLCISWNCSVDPGLPWVPAAAVIHDHTLSLLVRGDVFSRPWNQNPVWRGRMSSPANLLSS